ncbi:MAG: metallophosphoesterase, partial [archaeon]|nr:metallophosphoesterase [archaeon]
MENKKYIFIGKTVFFPKEKILAIADLHLGYEEALRQGGLEVPLRQLEEVLDEIDKILEYIKVKYGKVKQVIFLGDVKHHFSYLASEKEEIKKLISFLRKKGIEEQNIIFIRGNHEKNEKNGKLVDFYIVKDICFIHGHREFLEIYDQTINLIVMGHIHPTVIISDEMKIKNEKYKCFLVGRYKKKEIVIAPSFHVITEGVCLTEFLDKKGYDYSIVPNKEIENFEVYP